MAIVTSTSSGLNSATTNATVVVTKTETPPPTTVSTGLTNNFLTDSFFLPLVIALVGVWLYRAGFLGFIDWVDYKKSKHKDRLVQKKLQKKIVQIQQKETTL